VHETFVSLAAAIGDRARGAMLASLMDGRARTATELALDGDVAPSTASSHLARLESAGLIAVVRQGRHRYYRLASPDVARMVEGLMTVATPKPAPVPGPRDAALRRARVCYDHLAGQAGVMLFDGMRERGLVDGPEDTPVLTPAGDVWCRESGIDTGTLVRTRRLLCRGCLDWSERRMHLAGALGAALLGRLLAADYVRRSPTGRAVDVAPKGQTFLERLSPIR
jgi:DNA-binding transcriptional ArsR family regulator